MITTLHGVVQSLGPGQMVVEVGGVGLSLSVPTSVLEAAPAVGESIFLYTRLMVREDALALYGFSNLEERELFESLLQVSGIGPRLALAVISQLSLEQVRAAVANGQPEVLTSVRGIGRKTAEKIVFHLKDRIAAPPGIPLAPSIADVEVLSALSKLGYSLVEATTALRSFPPDAPSDTESRLRLALQYLGQS